MQKNFTTSDGAVLTYTDEGQGPALVMLPGWSQSAAMFRHQIEHFSSTHRVLAVDFRGHGKSPDAARGFRIFRFGYAKQGAKACREHGNYRVLERAGRLARARSTQCKKMSKGRSHRPRIVPR